MILDSLPYGMDMDETLQPEVSPSEWVHSAPIQDLLARGEQAGQPDPVEPPKPAADAEAKGPSQPATEVAAEDSGGVGMGHHICISLYSRECSKYLFEKEQCLYYHSVI